MDEQTRNKLHTISDRIVELLEQVKDLAEQKEYNFNDARQTNRAVEALQKEYSAIKAGASEEDRDKIERRYGRKVSHLLQVSAFLPKKAKGKKVALARGGGQSFGAQRATTLNSPAPRTVGNYDIENLGKLLVGSEIDAWCGPCGMLRLHAIVALVGEEPKKVICKTCNTQHGFRLTPARAKSGSPRAKVPQKKRPPTALEVRAQQAEQERQSLIKELADAGEVRPFNPRARYRAGEIIDHEEYGRGKIENVLKRGLLVRFRGGLRSIMT